jgi:hypothetical protein
MAASEFIFGDASGMSFGQSLWLMGRPDVNVFFGLWDGRHLVTPPNGMSSIIKSSQSWNVV